MADLPVDGNIVFQTDNMYDIGPAGANRPKDCYVARRVLVIDSNHVLGGNTNDMTVAHLGQDGTIQLRTGSANRWQITKDGYLQAVTDNAYDIGASAAGRPRDIYVGRLLEGSKQVRAKGWFEPGSPASGLATEIGITGGEGRLISYDRTAPAAYKPLLVSGSITYLGYDGNKAWQVVSGGHLQAVTDNLYDIGASSANRPRIGYFGSGVVVGSDGIKWKATASNVNVMYASGSEDIQILRHFGTKKSTLLKIWAPNGAVTDREATIALVRGDNDEEFIDIYNNGYPDGDPVSVQYGIRVQRRGTGSYQPFVFDQDDGAEHGVNIKKMFVLRSDRNAEFHGEWVQLPPVDADPSNPPAGAMWFNTFDHKLKFYDGTNVKVVQTV
jgi:hypothetical protein